MAKRGQKGKYNPELLGRIKIWVRNGATNKDICAKIGISEKTFYEWLNKHSNLREALKENKDDVDDQVENALLKRALGFEYEEVEETDGPNGFERKVKKKRALPSEVACFFWLKNRRPDKWREKRETELTGKNGGPIEVKNTNIDLSGLTDEELEKLEEIASRVKPCDAGNDSEGKG